MKCKMRMWKRWIAFVLCAAMALSLYPQQMVRADEDTCEHNYDGVEPEWMAGGDDAGGYTVTATLKCTICGKTVSVDSKDNGNMIVTPEDGEGKETIPCTCEEAGKYFCQAAVRFPANEKWYTFASDFVEIPAKGHAYDYTNPKWGTWDKKTEGWTIEAAFTCANNCGKPSTKDYVGEEIGRKEETCTEDGWIEYQVPQKDLDGMTAPEPYTESIPMLGHNYGEPKWNWNLQDGTATVKAVFTCKNAGCPKPEYTNTAIVEKKTTDPTCTEPGGTVYRAMVNVEGKIYTDTLAIGAKPALGHDYQVSWEAWTQKNGKWTITAVLTCAKCGHKESVEVEGVETGRKEATCTAAGSVTYQAYIGTGIPGETEKSPEKTVTLEKTGHAHVMTGWVWKWNDKTENYDVKAAYICKRCDGEDGKTADAKVTRTVTEAACTASGKIVYEAKVTIDGKEYSDTRTSQTPALGHAYGEPKWGKWSTNAQTGECQVTVTFTCSHGCKTTITKTVAGREISREEPTCTKEGKITYQAQAGTGVPGETASQTYEIKLPVAGHKMVKTAAKAATCEKAGNKEYNTCKVCKKYFSDGQGKKEIKKNSWVINKKGHKIVSVTAVKPTKTKAGKLIRRCSLCKKEEETIEIPKTLLEVEVGKSASVVKNPSKCKVSIKNASSYKKYLTLDAKKGMIKTKKNYSVKFKESIPLTVKIADKTYKVNVKVKIPAPKMEIKKEQVGDYYRFTFKYNVKGADKIQVRCNLKDAKQEVLDKYLSKPKSDKDSYVYFKDKNVTFTITAYYGKNVSEKKVIKK